MGCNWGEFEWKNQEKSRREENYFQVDGNLGKEKIFEP